MTKIKSFLESINWKVRAKNKVFWVTLVPSMLVLVGQVLQLFGVTLDYEALSGQLVEIIESLFIVLGIVGIVADPTTKGVSDSTQALEYTAPKED